jgi:cation diffusion facilitator CzcD-associated flavoprotein CzcO
VTSENGHHPTQTATLDPPPAASSNGAGPRHTQVAIVGSGFSGLGMGIRLKQSGRDDFIIFEKSEDIGGTWHDNTYPGIACDVPSNMYSFSFALNPTWSKSYSGGQEIWDYLRNCATRYEITPNIRLNTAVLETRWDDAAQVWRIRTTAGEFTSNFLVAGAGPLNEPQIPNLPGIENFKGTMFHSREWDHDYDLKGKRVAVVGTGASAIQFVPQIQPEVKELHLFQRTAPWVMPRSDRSLSKLEHFIFKRAPIVQKMVRASVYTFLEVRVVGFVKHPRIMKRLQKIAELHIARQVPDRELRKKITPDYTIGCKRVLMANNYYPALCEPNVEVVTEGVKEVREHSVIAADGTEREVDAIIWGTGFHVTDPPIANYVYGRDGKSLAGSWNGSMQAYLGTAVSNFPNFFMLLGPNTGLGHNSVVYMAEASMEQVMRAIQFAEKNDVASLEVRKDAEERFSSWVQKNLETTIWQQGGCASWYMDATGRNTTLWPGFTFKFRQISKQFDPAKYIVRDREGTEMVPLPAEPAARPAAVPA